MSTFFVVCFLTGLGLSIVSFVSGLQNVSVFDNIFGNHGGLKVHVPKLHAPKGHGAKLLKGSVGQKGSVSPINMAALTAFLAWFGGTGVVMQQFGFLSAATIGSAAGAGVVGASVVNRFISALLRRETTVEALTMIGTIGRVTVTIREGGTGEIVFSHGGTRQVAGARSDSGVAIAKGSEVVVTGHEKGIAYVATWDELTPP